jgi:HSP20 family protein
MSQVQDPVPAVPAGPAGPAEPLRTERIPADLIETAEGWEIHLALPGVAEPDVELQVERGTLTVHAVRRAHSTENVRVLRAGPGEARLEREFVLPDGVAADAVEATLESGVLRVSFARPAAERRSIPIRQA